MNVFYVYEHWRTDRDECFYVGKGKGKRAYRMSWRNPYHQAIINKVIRTGYAIEVRIVASNLSEQEAFDLEKERIKFWHESNIELSNMTDGGEGVSNPTEEVRKKISNALKGNKNGVNQKLSDERRKFISQIQIGNKNGIGNKSRKGQKISLEERKKLSDAQKLRRAKETPEERIRIGAFHKNKIVSEETKKKMSESIKKSWAKRRLKV